MWLASEEFSDQALEVRSTHVFCLACNSQLGHAARYLRQHCFGDQAKSARQVFITQPDAEKSRLRHFKNLQSRMEDIRRGQVLRAAIEIERQKMFASAERTLFPRNGLFDDEIAARVNVFETLAGAGIPLSKLNDDSFLKLIQKDGPRLGGRAGVVEVMLFVAKRQSDAITKTLAGRMVSVCCDGSKANALAEGAIVRFISGTGDIVHVCIGLSRIDRSLDGHQLRGLVQHHLDSCGVLKDKFCV